MKCITPSILSFCLLILATACTSKQSANSPQNPVHSVGKKGLFAHIQESPKPYVLVNFYATWCKPCIKELPELIALKNDPEAPTDVMLVSVDEPHVRDRQLPSFLEKLAVTFPSFHLSPDSLASLAKQVYPDWNTTIPLNFVYTNKGRLVEATGMTDQKEILMIIREDQVFNN